MPSTTILDRFKYVLSGIADPGSRIESVTPDDNTDLARPSRALNVETTGVVAVVTIDGDDDTLYIAAGIPFGIRVSRVKATGTTATNIKSIS